MKTCPDCGEQNLDFKDHCQKCGASLKKDNYSTISFPSQKTNSPTIPDDCQFSMVFYVLAWLCLLGGVAGVFLLWPRYYLDITSLFPSLIPLVSGFISFALFYAVGKGLNYLHWISNDLSILVHINSKIAESIKIKEKED